MYMKILRYVKFHRKMWRCWEKVGLYLQTCIKQTGKVKIKMRQHVKKCFLFEGVGGAKISESH